MAEPQNSEIVEITPEEAKPKRSRRKLMLIGGGAAVLALGGGGAAYALLGGSGGSATEAHGEAAAEGHGEGESGTEAFVDVPPMLVNLRSPDGAQHMLKLRFMIVPAAGANAQTIKKKLPMILDAYQPFLRELRPEDLAGSAAVFRIKEELLLRANNAAGAGSVKDILIQDLVQQ